jgi:hypothetical protein
MLTHNDVKYYGVFLSPKISILFPTFFLDTPFSFFYKKIMQSKFLPKNDFHCIMLYARFLTNFKSHIYKMDIFKNVQNQKLPTNLERPFFWDPNLRKYAVKNHIVCMYVYNDTTCGVFGVF